MNSVREVNKRHPLAIAIAASAFALAATPVLAQDTADTEIEEIAVVGSQIKGASISEALAVNVLGSADIEAMGVDSLEDLLDILPENGNNFFNEAENISGGVNSARGDIGAFNLRSLGTGNTLVLLNGRRMVNSASYQTEEVGGSFVPVNTVNANTIAVAGLERVEVLRDGASAIYGADAVAGVINHVLQDDYEGFSIRGKWTEFDNLPRDDQTLTLKWGTDFNDGASNISAFYNFYQRDRVSAQDDERWADSDLRSRLDPDSPWASGTAFRNDSANSLYGQFDMSGSVSGMTDSRGEFEVYPIGDSRCSWALTATTCAAPDGQGVERYNLNEFRDLASELERQNLMVNITHEFANGVESFTELMAYQSKTNTNRHPSASFSSSKLSVGVDNPYNPFGTNNAFGVTPKELLIDNYRFAEVPRIVENNGDTFRVLQGLRGTFNDWDWETAVSWSKATKEDITHNRVSNTLMQEALNDSSLDAYNPFSGGVDSNIERALITVRRDSETELKTFDFKISNSDVFTLPAGPVGALVGFEVREESFADDRDPRLDGTIQFTDRDGDTYPYVSDVVNSSPTPDNNGERVVTSLFGELQIPVLDNLDVQLAARYEDFDDVGDTTVGKAAFGWTPIEEILIRGSWSEAFRAPNLVTINEEIVARTGTRDDWSCWYAYDNSTHPDAEDLDCSNSIQRIAQGAQDLQPETSTNTSIGLVFSPVDQLQITIDYWKIDKENTIGLFGEENHTLLDLVYRVENGLNNCDTASFNTAVNREDADADYQAIYNAAGICAAGDVKFIDDRYANLDRRVTEGHDVGLYYNMDTKYGSIDFRYNISFLTKLQQEAGGNAALLVEAQNNGVIPSNYPVAGFADLVGVDGNQSRRDSFKLAWRMNQWGATLSGQTIGSFHQDSLTLSDGSRWYIEPMTTLDATVDYRFKMLGANNRVRVGVKNLADKRAPLADRYFGFFADAHKDYGRYMYVDLRMNF